jgi:hypothetical protein
MRDFVRLYWWEEGGRGRGENEGLNVLILIQDGAKWPLLGAR